MSFESSLKEELATGELVGKVYPLNAPEGTKAPYLVYLSSDGVPDNTLGGFLSTKQVRGELNIIHGTYDSMKSLTGSVLSKLRSFQGRNIGVGGAGPFVQYVDYDNPIELFESEIRQYRCVISFELYF